MHDFLRASQCTECSQCTELKVECSPSCSSFSGDGLRDRLDVASAMGADGYLGPEDGVLQGAQLQHLGQGQAGHRDRAAPAPLEVQPSRVSSQR